MSEKNLEKLELKSDFQLWCLQEKRDAENMARRGYIILRDGNRFPEEVSE